MRGKATRPTRTWPENPIHLAARHWLNWRRALGRRQCVLPADQLPGLQPECRHGRDQRDPGELTAVFNFRFSTESTVEGLQQRVDAILDKHGLDYHLDWALSVTPFHRTRVPLDGVAASIKAVTGVTQPSTSGGTSDGRFIATSAPRWSKLARSTPTIHQVDERIGQ